MTDKDFPALGFDPALGDVAAVRTIADELQKSGDLASEHLDDWPYFVAMLDSIAHSVSFSNGETSSIADRLSGAL